MFFVFLNVQFVSYRECRIRYYYVFLCLFLSVLTICSFWLDCLIHLYLILLIWLNLHLPLILFCINKQMHEYVVFLFLLFILKLAYYRYIPVTFFHVIYILYISTLTASHDFFHYFSDYCHDHCLMIIAFNIAIAFYLVHQVAKVIYFNYSHLPIVFRGKKQNTFL